MKPTWLKEAAIGVGLALTVYAAMQGVDITPIVLLSGVVALLLFMRDGRGVGRRFEVGGGNDQSPMISKVTFADIGGQEVAKREFLEALEFMKDSEKVRRLGIRPLKGILLSGPPGTGKTLMAKAAAHYTDSAFLSASGSQFVEMYAGVGAQRVRQIFKKARQSAKQQGKGSAIIFIDEIDVLGGKRGQHTSHLEYDQTLNQLLTEMDGIQDKEEIRVLVVAATNRADLLDPALLRPGRFDRQVRVDLPDREGRLHILKIHTRGKPITDDVDLDALARECFGFSGAHLESLVNEAAIQALRAGREQILAADFKEAVDKVMMGEKLDRKPTPAELERVAYHEMGHAIVSELVRPGSVSTVTITSRGAALGYMRQAPDDDRYLYTVDELKGQIAVCLGGSMAEEIALGNRSTGATGDFDQAIHLAKKMVYAGLSSLGVVGKEHLPDEVLHRTIGEIIREQEDRVKQWLSECRKVMERAKQVLMENERISGERLRKLLGMDVATVEEPVVA